MAGDFTQDASLTRICQRTCHLQQTCQLTRMEFGIETDQFPNCQARRGSDSVTLFCQVQGKKNSTFCLECIVNFSLFLLLFFLFGTTNSLHPWMPKSDKVGLPMSRWAQTPRKLFFLSLSDHPTAPYFFPSCREVGVYVHCVITRRIALALRPHFSIVKLDTQSFLSLQSSFLLCFVTTIVSISQLSKPHRCVGVEPLSIHVFGMVSKL